jgi:recombinational DNA repair ATPase RecF
MHLYSLEIKNFRKISHLTVPFSRGFNILLGENNVGKTTVVEIEGTYVPNFKQFGVAFWAFLL